MLRIIICLLFFSTSILGYAEEDYVTTNPPKYNIQEYDPQRLPEIAFFDEHGKAHLLEEFENQVVLLTFWATWCTSCLNEIQDLDTLQKEFKKKPLKVIAVSQDFKGISAVDEFYKLHEIKYLEKYIDQKSQLFNALNVIGIPTSIIIDHQNREVARVVGAVDWSDQTLRALLNKHLLAVPNVRNDLDGNELQPSSNRKNLMLDIKKPNQDNSQLPKDSVTVPNQKELPKDSSVVPNNSQLPKDSVTVPNQKELPKDSSVVPNNSQLPKGSVTPSSDREPTKSNIIPREAITNIIPKI